MFLRLLAGSFMIGGLMFSIIGVTQANGSSVPTPVHKAPELDPTAMGGGVLILSGGLFLLSERRRNRR